MDLGFWKRSISWGQSQTQEIVTAGWDLYFDQHLGGGIVWGKRACIGPDMPRIRSGRFDPVPSYVKCRYLLHGAFWGWNKCLCSVPHRPGTANTQEIKGDVDNNSTKHHCGTLSTMPGKVLSLAVSWSGARSLLPHNGLQRRRLLLTLRQCSPGSCTLTSSLANSMVTKIGEPLIGKHDWQEREDQIDTELEKDGH